MKVAQQGFEGGKVSFISLIDAERLLLEFQLAHERALADRAKRLAEIEALINKDLSGNGWKDTAIKPSDGGS